MLTDYKYLINGVNPPLKGGLSYLFFHKIFSWNDSSKHFSIQISNENFLVIQKYLSYHNGSNLKSYYRYGNF